MNIQEQFYFLENESRCYEIDEQKGQIVFRFKEGEYRGLIGIPKNEDTNFWYKYFIKGDKFSYKNGTPIEKLPNWFKELVERASEKVEKRDRVRKMFKRNYFQEEFKKTKS